MDPIMTDLSAPMSSAQVKAARAAFGWTQTELADAIGLDGPYRGHTVRAWENGKNPITGPARTAIRALLLFRQENGGNDFTPALARAINRARSTPDIADVFTEIEPIQHAA